MYTFIQHQLSALHYYPLSDELHPSASPLIRLRGGESLDNCWVPHIHHLLVSRCIGMNAVAQIAAGEPRVLIDNPDG